MSRDRLECLAKAIKRLIREENRHSDPPSAHYIPHDLAHWFLEAAKRFLNGDVKSLDRALELSQRRGRPFDPGTSGNLDLAEEGFRLKYECGLSWKEVLNRVNALRRQPIDERTMRKMIESHRPAIYRRRADALVRRLPKIRSIKQE
jgi:hypothetical protein